MGQLYLDEDVSGVSGRRLNFLGDDALDARGVLQHATKDHQHLAMATRLGRILITHNSDDYLFLHLAWREWFDEFGQSPSPEHAGILLLPQPPELGATDIADLVHNFMAERTAAGLRNRLFQWARPGGWEEIVPTPPRLVSPDAPRRRF
jgi:hypothetical protein